MSITVKHTLLLTLIVILGTFLYTYKLDYEYFFVDEVVYTQAGLANLRGDYTLAREVAPVGKYLAGLSAYVSDRNIFLLRLPFSMLALLSAIPVYYIIKQEYGRNFALLGVALFLFSPFINSSSRMVMLEPVQHLLWLIFHLIYLNFLSTSRKKYMYLTGILIGLSLATKISSVILLPFFTVTYFLFLKLNKTRLLNFFVIILTTGATFLLTHIGLMAREGIHGLVLEAQNIYDKYFANRDQTGKEHVIGGKVYNFSPWWYYLYYLRGSYPITNLIVSLLSPFVILSTKNKFITYWTIFFVIDFIFFQSLGVKAPRYIASIELPLVFLTTALIKEISNRSKNKSISTILVLVIMGGLLYSRVSYLVTLNPTEYTALKNYLTKRTNNFTNGERTLIFGSVRSAKWTFAEFNIDSPAKPIVIRKDNALRCEYDTFKYLVIDRDEKLKNEEHVIFKFISSNTNRYDKLDIGGLDVFVRKEGAKDFIKDDCIIPART